MITFFTILFILAALNVVLIAFSLKGNATKTASTNRTTTDASKVYPLITATKYKKAI